MLARTRFGSRSIRRCRRSNKLGLALLALTLGGRAGAQPVPAVDAPAARAAPTVTGSAGAHAAAPVAKPAAAAGSADGFSVSGFAQVDWVIHRQSSQDELDPATREPLNEDRFLLRRGRIRLGAGSGFVGGRLIVDANTVRSPVVRPFEALVFARYPTSVQPEQLSAAEPARTSAAAEAPELAASLGAGLLPIPFGFDPVERDLARPFLERTLASRAFFGQARDLGVVGEVGYRFARLSLAATNGEPLSEDRYAGRDLTRKKDLVGRAGVSLVLVDGLWLQAGVSWLLGSGLHLGTPETKDSLAWVDGNENGLIEVTELTPVPGVPAAASRAFERSALGGDLRLGVRLPLLGELQLRAEIVRAVNLDRTLVPADPIASGRQLRELGAYVGVSQELTRFAELAVRYEVYDPDADARRQQAGAVVPVDPSFRTLSVALAGKLEPARLLLQYDFNDNALGRSASGAPERLRDDAFTLRLEGSFR